jgi:hypothetical protein
MSENIRMFRTATGEDVIAEYVETTELGDVYKNAIQLVIVPSRTNPQEQSYAFAPFPHYSQKGSDLKLTFNKERIVFFIEVEDEFLGQYNSVFGHITTPSPKFILGK